MIRAAIAWLHWLASYRHEIAALIWPSFCPRCDKQVTRWHWRRCPCLVVDLDAMAESRPDLADAIRSVFQQAVQVDGTGLDRIRARTVERDHLGASVCQSLGDAFSRKTPT